MACASKQPVALAPNPTTQEPVLSVPVRAKAVVVDKTIPKDPAIDASLIPLKAEMQTFTQRIVAELDGPLTRGKPESTLGNFVADAMMQHMKKTTGVQPDFCFTNLGGLRTDLPAGPLTAGQVTELMPFDNAIVFVDISGEQADVLLARLAQRGDPMAGLRYRQPGTDFEIGGQPYSSTKKYIVCTTDYIFGGGSNYPFHPETNATYTGVLLRDAIEKTMSEMKVIPAYDLQGRVLPPLKKVEP